MGWPILITLLGWISFLRGIARLFFAEKANKVLNWWLTHKTYLNVACVVGLLIGLYLLYFGFIA